VLVYAGAVMVLFLFIIMLLDLRVEERRKINKAAWAGGALVALVFFLQVIAVVSGFRPGHQPFPR
jgi:NADH-quinone oxidoreductase subunit J